MTDKRIKSNNNNKCTNQKEEIPMLVLYYILQQHAMLYIQFSIN